MGYIIIYVHNVHHDKTLIANAVQMIDQLDPILKKHNDTKGVAVPIEVLSEINKEYLSFIGQKKQMIESFKKYTKDHLKQLEEFQMDKLTALMNSKFTNVEQLSYKCTICNNYVGKSKRALTTHQNKCKKANSQIVVYPGNNNSNNEKKNEVVNLDETVE